MKKVISFRSLQQFGDERPGEEIGSVLVFDDGTEEVVEPGIHPYAYATAKGYEIEPPKHERRRTIVVDPTTEQVFELIWQAPPTLKQIYILLGCDMIELVRLGPDIAMYIDECGLISGDNHIWRFKETDTVFAGRTMIFGIDASSDEPTSLADTYDLAMFQKQVEFLGLRDQDQLLELGEQFLITSSTTDEELKAYEERLRQKTINLINQPKKQQDETENI